MSGYQRVHEFGVPSIYVIFVNNEYLPILKRVITESIKERSIQTLPTEKGTILVTEFDFDDYSKVVEQLKTYNLGLSKYRESNLIWDVILLK